MQKSDCFDQAGSLVLVAWYMLLYGTLHCNVTIKIRLELKLCIVVKVQATFVKLWNLYNLAYHHIVKLISPKHDSNEENYEMFTK